MIALLLTLLAQIAPVPPTGAKATILTRLTADGRAALAAEVEAVAPAQFDIAAAPEFAALKAAIADPSRRVALLYGVSLAELEELRGAAATRLFTPLRDAPPSPFDPVDREYAHLFADPVVLAIDRARVLADLGRDVETVLPNRPAALCGGKFEATFFASEVRLHSASGAFVGHLAFAERGAVESLLAGLGANLASRTAPTDAAALERTLAEGAPAFALVTESSVLRLPADTVLAPIRAFGNSLAVHYGAAVLASHPSAEAVLSSLLAAPVVARIAAAERLVPLRVKPSDLSPEQAIVLQAITDEAPRLPLEITRIREWVPRYGGELREALSRKQQSFEDTYDVVFLLAILGVGAWLLLKHRPADDPRR
jgi:hypothetical protein